MHDRLILSKEAYLDCSEVNVGGCQLLSTPFLKTPGGKSASLYPPSVEIDIHN